jgi:hypothetical protein
MFLPEKLPVATQTPPQIRREIHLFVDRAAPRGPTLTIEPRGVVEKEAVNEIIDALGFPLRARNAGLRGASDCVVVAALICERHGWARVADWLDEAKDLHVRMAKEGA